MRKSDKLKNFKKANLLAENRYFESKGFINENLTSEDVLINTIESKLKEIENGSLPKEVGIGIYLRQLEVMNPEMYDLYSEKYKNVIRHSNIGLDEENIFSRAGKKISDFGHRLLDMPTKEEEAKKQKAIDEIINFNFKSLFYQPSEGELLKAEIADKIIDYAAKEMPTVKELNPILFEVKGGYFSNATMKIDGKLYRGVIPNCFEPIRDVNDEISNEEAIRRMIGFLG